MGSAEASGILLDLATASRIVLGAVLSAAALAKAVDPSGLRDQLTRLGAHGPLVAIAPAVVVAAELATVGLLAVGSALSAGLAVVVLFAGFAAVVMATPAKDGSTSDCGCFGAATKPPRHRRLPQVLSRVAGAAAGGLVLVGGGDGLGWPSNRSVWLAAGGLCLLVLRVPDPLSVSRRTAENGLWDVRRNASHDGTAPVTMGRRNLLKRFGRFAGGAAAIGVLGPLAKAFACVSNSMPCGASASIDSESVDHDHGADRSPCFHACNERRVVDEVTANDALDASAGAAGEDEDALIASADAFRAEILRFETEYSQCQARC